jgi:glycosyltransferase involved in cell wall biosynthesis
MTDGRALMVVEREFLSRHTGVLRVIAHYREILRDLGYSVDFGFIDSGEVRIFDEPSAVRIADWLEMPRRGADVAWWTSGAPWRDADDSEAPAGADLAPDLAPGGWARSLDYKVSIVTNPWLCEVTMPVDRFTHGIVYDLVPNLMASQVLNLGRPAEVWEFAGAHHRGFEFYRQNVDTVVCISQSTRRDFQHFYQMSERRVVVDIPFRAPSRTDVNATWREAPSGLRILAVNALDYRKSIAHIVDGLVELSRDIELELTIVGRERMEPADVRRLLSRLDRAGVTTTWYRSASDHLLEDAYRWADLLLFPSLYEGLGLPILEAQCAGLPVITSSIASCAEVNLNPLLTLDDISGSGLVEGMRRILARDPELLHGAALRDATVRWIGAPRGTTFAVVNPDAFLTSGSSGDRSW